MQPESKASLRGIDMLLSHKMNVKTLRLPPEKMTRTLSRARTLRRSSAPTWRSMRPTSSAIRRKVMLAEMKNDPQQRIAAINSVVESIAHIPDVVSRDVYIRSAPRCWVSRRKPSPRLWPRPWPKWWKNGAANGCAGSFPEAMQPTPVSAPGTDVAGVSGQPASAPALPHEVRQQPLAVGTTDAGVSACSRRAGTDALLCALWLYAFLHAGGRERQ